MDEDVVLPEAGDMTEVEYHVINADGSVMQSGRMRRCRLVEFPLSPGQTIHEGVPPVTESAENRPTPENVRAVAGHLLRRTDWMVTRSQEPGGKPVPEDVLAQRRWIRDRASEIEKMVPIPDDYRDGKWWTRH